MENIKWYQTSFTFCNCWNFSVQIRKYIGREQAIFIRLLQLISSHKCFCIYQIRSFINVNGYPLNNIRHRTVVWGLMEQSIVMIGLYTGYSEKSYQYEEVYPKAQYWAQFCFCSSRMTYQSSYNSSAKVSCLQIILLLLSFINL